MKEIVIYISSRNNYEMLKLEVFKNNNFEGFEFVNVDDNSSEQQKELGKRICAENNVQFIENKGRGVYAALQTISDLYKNDKRVKFAYWLTHDCYPITTNMFDKLNDLCIQRKLDEFGCIGFNTIWKKFTMSVEEFRSRKLEGNYCGVLGRALVTPVPSVGWYRSFDFSLPWNVWGKSIALEGVTDMNMMINLQTFRKHVVTDEAFKLFGFSNDLAMQFLMSGCYNVVLTNLYVYHDQNIKGKYKIPLNSYRAACAGDDYHFCSHDGHYDRWNSKWGFTMGWQRDLDRLPNHVIKKYEGTLIHDFATHDYRKGPLKVFKI